MTINQYRRLNIVFGWAMYLIAAIVYFKTMEPTVSFWDCGEFIASAYRLQVGHQPGAPLFVMIGKVLSLIAADKSQVAFWVNTGSALASSATIMFLFWTITTLALKLARKGEDAVSHSTIAGILGAGVVGALAFTFSDTFWFSAVEAEVYALSSLCTAIVFWAALRWAAHCEEPYADRWLVFISYIVGLSIGIHLLNLLAIPAIVLLWYNCKTKKITFKGSMLAVLTGCLILGIVQYGVIQYLVFFAAKFDIFFVNTIGLGFGSGAFFFVVVVVSALWAGIAYSIKKQKRNLNLGLVCFAFVLIGYTSYAMILIRSNAKTAINISSQSGTPDNAPALLGYLGRDQYGDRPLLYGQYFDANPVGYKTGFTIYRKGEKKYEPAGSNDSRIYDRNTILPRIYSDDPAGSHQLFYKNWLNLADNQQASFKDNLSFLISYQAGFMYMRYFMWNFAGKQDDEQGSGDRRNGNWLTGIKPLDATMLGNQSELPLSITGNEGYNRFYALPFILGLLGLIYQYRKHKNDAGVIGLLFFFTGLAIVLYLNQNPLQVRERDYVYVGSFYAFSIWIGLGVLAVKELLSRISPARVAAYSSVFVCALAVPYIMGSQGWDDHNRSDRYTAHDMAVNYLNSCAPNAILFCNADNDTYPLWYVQHVEGVRPDVRIVNEQLLYNDSYIDQLKEQLFDSAPLPITMSKNKYVRGVRDYLPYVDYGFKDSVELQDLFEVMTSDNESDKVEMQSGEKYNFLPSKKFRMSVNAKQVIKSGTVKPSDINRIANKLDWIYPKDYATRADLAMIDILAHNNWERPIYFTTQLSKDSYMGLDKYLYSEGYAFRLLPIHQDVQSDKSKEELTNSDVMYRNLVSKFNLTSFNEASYLDPESRRVSGLTWRSFNVLTANLIAEGKKDEARKTMQKALTVLPLKNYSLIDTATKADVAKNLYDLGNIAAANKLLIDATSFIDSELNYYASLDEAQQQENAASIRYAVYILQEFRSLAVLNKQRGITSAVDATYNKIQNRIVLGEG